MKRAREAGIVLFIVFVWLYGYVVIKYGLDINQSTLFTEKSAER